MHITPLTIKKDTAVIHLTRGFHCLVDTELWEWLSRWKWNALVHKSGDPSYTYARRSIGVKGKNLKVMMHRQIAGAPKGTEVDHRNHRGLDNRRDNLLVTTRRGNAQNQRKRRDATSRFFGVCRMGGQWIAQAVGPKGTSIRLGVFENEVDAARCRDEYIVGRYENPVLNNAG